MAHFMEYGEWLLNPEQLTSVGVMLDKVTICLCEVNGERMAVEISFRGECAEASLRWLRNQQVIELW